MTLAELKSRIAELIGEDANDATTDSMLEEWINDSYLYICGKMDWPWLYTNDIIQTSADITTGTVSINAGDTALTFSSAPSVSVANDWRIQFAASDDWYDITSHTGGNTAATLSDGYTASSNLSGGTYTLRRVYYSLPTNFSRMISVRQARDDNSLTPLDIRFKDRILPDPTDTGDPNFYSIYGKDSSGNYRLIFESTPSTKMNIDVRYKKKPTAMSTASDTPVEIPEEFHSILIFDVLYRYGYSFIDDERRKDVKEARAEILADMIANRNPNPSKITKKRPFDWAWPTSGRVIAKNDYPVE